MIFDRWMQEWMYPYPHTLRYSVGKWTVVRSFRDREIRDAFREHIVRVYGAKIIL